MTEERVECRTPTPGKSGTTRIPKWKYDCIRAAILDAVGGAGEAGFAWGDLSDAVRDRLTADQLANLGKVGWHTVCVKLEMEVSGELKRMDGVKPQRLVLA